MAEAKCTRCGATASGATFSEASSKLNHAQGKSRGKPCGASYNRIIEIKTNNSKSESTIPKVETPKKETESEKTEPKKTEKSKSNFFKKE